MAYTCKVNGLEEVEKMGRKWMHRWPRSSEMSDCIRLFELSLKPFIWSEKTI